MSRRPTIGDVAQAAGVSRTTVSHALRGMGQVNAETRQRVLDAAERLGYRPSARARSLRLGTTNSIALMSSMPTAVSAGSSRMGFFTEVAAAAAETALMRGYSLVLVPPAETAQSPFAHVDVDGAILVEPRADDPLAAELTARYLPFVSIGRLPGSDAPHVEMQGGRGAALLLEHLRERGARTIALVCGASERHSYVDTLQAYADFCAGTGQEQVVARIDEAEGEEGGYAATSQLLQAHPDLDGLCVVIDALATGALRAIRDAGLRVPEDVLLATRYDGVRAKVSEPPLTALDLHLPEIAAAAVDLLLRTLKGEAGTPTSVMAEEPGLVARRSTDGLRR
ncbi:LacI family DNA-binding transcriptional regulator [Ornithinimicrobium panacihumi]|uniref:LacI family DNA-binding transcriptional regulator n=1 Tax=Ornithinimicrobium panacihumi TaxID=2008449 RepID=UPI003F88B417